MCCYGEMLFVHSLAESSAAAAEEKPLKPLTNQESDVTEAFVADEDKPDEDKSFNFDEPSDVTEATSADEEKSDKDKPFSPD